MAKKEAPAQVQLVNKKEYLVALIPQKLKLIYTARHSFVYLLFLMVGVFVFSCKPAKPVEQVKRSASYEELVDCSALGANFIHAN